MNMVDGYHGLGSGTSETAEYQPVHVRRQRSMKFSLYPAARPRTASKSSNISGSTSPTLFSAPQLSPTLSAHRQDPLPNQYPYQRPYPSQSQTPGSEGRSFTSPPVVGQNLYKKPSEASRLRALNNGYRSHSSDGRQTPESLGLENGLDNFSRPRQPSVRRRNESPKPILHTANTFPLQAYQEDQLYAQQSYRDRGLSTSSSQSAAAHQPAYPIRPSASIPDYQSAESIYSRHRNLTNPNYRPARGPSRPDSNSSATKREPLPYRSGFEDEEIRASFRSALTTSSSFLGTSGTERSSVLTKSSSRTSMFEGRDEGMSVDDAIGMYEGGFTDSDVGTNYGTRPTTATSEQKQFSGEVMNGSHAMEPSKEYLSEAPTNNGSLRSFPLKIDTLAVPSAPIVRDSAHIFKYGLNSPGIPQGDGQHESLPVRENYFEKSPTTPATGFPTESFDDTRDRYGFRKKSQHVPLDKYEAWAAPYAEHVDRRRKKWVALMKDNKLNYSNPTQFPARSDRVKRFVRKGVPPEWRGAAWWWYAGGPTLLAQNPGVYDNLMKRAANGEVSQTDDEIIERDLNRTFPDNIKFKPDPPATAPDEKRNSRQTLAEPETPMLQALRRVLQAFSIHNPKIGYCQSLNFLAGLLLLFMDEEKSFWMLNTITRVYLPGTHELNLEGANVDLGVLMNNIQDMMPSIWAKIGGELDGSNSSAPSSALRLPPISLCTTAWFMSCFIGTLPIETTLRVWDSFFYEGSKTLFRIALTIFKVGEQEIKAVNDPMEIFQVVQTIPRRLVDANLLMDTCYKRRNGFGHLSQDTIEKGRVERRKGYAAERDRVARGDIPVPTTPGLARSGTKRTGALFRRKKATEA